MMEIKIDKIQEDITELKVHSAEMRVISAQMAATLTENTLSLKEHMKRTEMSERRLNILEGVWYTLCAGGTVVVALHAMGILQRLF